ncbi:hypothetical protein DCAR_0102002 [Daucus carota subsp. sativus]|uniref:Uncharacterized protein n=1 Tax=Daucus carota subsp. sativus TaxID=79200 RepID=A0AAF0W4A8_DAUCS|nr:hypothetical protein DCAR_0102002 [Daucus carota subsp. sativus]
MLISYGYLQVLNIIPGLSWFQKVVLICVCCICCSNHCSLQICFDTLYGTFKTYEALLYFVSIISFKCFSLYHMIQFSLFYFQYSKRKFDDLYAEHTLNLGEALCRFQFALTHFDGRQLIIKSNPRKRPFIKGRLFIHFNVEFPKSGFLSPEKCKSLETVLPVAASSTLLILICKIAKKLPCMMLI